MTNHHWDVTRVLRGSGQRWTGTETLPRDGKPPLGLGACLLRGGEGQTRHLSLVLLGPSLLVAPLRQGRVRAWAHATLTPRGEEAPVTLKQLKVTRPPNTYLMQIAYRSADPQLAADAANEVTSRQAQGTLPPRGEACRAVRRETLGKTITWAIERPTLEGWHPERIKAPLQLT